MAIRYAETGVFGTDGDFDNNANWAAASPTANAWIIRLGSTSIDTNPDQSAHTFTDAEFARDYTGEVMSTGNPLRLVATNLYYSGGGAKAFIDGNFTQLLMNCPKILTSEQLHYGVTNASAATTTLTKRGYLTIGANATVTTVKTSTDVDTNVRVVIGTGATITNVEQGGGLITNVVAVALVVQAAGEFTHTTGTITNYYLNGGIVNVNSGVVTTLHAMKGIARLDQTTEAKRVTNLIIGEADVFLGEQVNALDTMTITREGNGRLFGQDGQVITIS